MPAWQLSLAVQELRQRWLLQAPAPQEPMQGVRWLANVPAQEAARPLCRVRRLTAVPAQPAEVDVQALRRLADLRRTRLPTGLLQAKGPAVWRRTKQAARDREAAPGIEAGAPLGRGEAAGGHTRSKWLS